MASSNMEDIKRLKQQSLKKFDMKDLGPTKNNLRMKITRDKKMGTLQLSQESKLDVFCRDSM